MVIDVYRYIQTVPCKGVLVIPRFERQNFWPVITIDGIHFKPEFKKFFEFHPKITTGSESPGSVFKHGERKKMLALLFDSKTSNPSSLQARCSFNKCGLCE